MARLADDCGCACLHPLSRRACLQGLCCMAVFGRTARAAQRIPEGVTVSFENSSTALLSNASAADSLTVYYARGDGKRVARFDLSTTSTDTRTYRPLELRYRPTTDETTVRLSARGSLVRVVVERDDGGRDAWTSDVEGCVPAGFNDPPTASFTATTPNESTDDGGTLDVLVGDPVTFTTTATDPDLPSERLRPAWDFDGDGEFETFGCGVTTTYDEPGTRVVTHRVTDDFEASATATLTVAVRRPWRLVEKLVPAGLGAGDQFGIGIAMSDGTLGVGAPGDDEHGVNAGAAYVFDSGDLTAPPTRLVPAGLDSGDVTAMSLAVVDGSLAVSAVCDDDEGRDSGAVYVYDLADLTAPPTKLAPPELVAGTLLGYSLAGHGHTLVAGAHLDGERAAAAGSLFVFDLTDPTRRPTKLVPAELAALDQFGISVAVTASAVVGGAVGDDDGDCRQSGAVYVYDRTDLSDPPRKLAPDGVETADQFGRPIAAEGETLVVGVPFDDDGGEESGVVYVYDLTDLTAPPTKVVPDGLAPGDLFGYAVSVSADTLAVGAIGDDDAGPDAGAVYLYDRTDLSATPTKVVPDGLAPGDLFGFAVSVSDDRLAAGAIFDDTRGASAGAVYVFER